MHRSARYPRAAPGLEMMTPDQDPPPPQAKPADRLWFGTYLLILAGLAVAHGLLGSTWSPLPLRYMLLGQRLVLGGVAAVLGPEMEARVKVYCELLAKRPVDALEIQGRVRFPKDDLR